MMEIKTEFLFTIALESEKYGWMNRICSIAPGALTVGGPFLDIGNGVLGSPELGPADGWVVTWRSISSPGSIGQTSISEVALSPVLLLERSAVSC
jgi:hypothetical protein